VIDIREISMKQLPSLTLVSKRYEVRDRTMVLAIVSEVTNELEPGETVRPILVIDFGTVEDGIELHVGVPGDRTHLPGDYEVIEVEPVHAISALHDGDYAGIRDTYLEMYATIRERGLVPQTNSRELVLHMDPSRPQDTVVEIQWPLHDWTGLLAGGVEEVLGPEARDQVMEGVDVLSPETSREERFEWVMAALLRLDGIADEEQKYRAVSVCADCYPAWRLEKLRQIYLDTGSVDLVMEEMKGDTEWYSTPHREGSLISHTKVPYDREAWEAADDRDAKRRAYCHCALVQDRIDQVPPTYCYCGTGWVRQVWEGVLQRPIRVEVLKSLPAGDDECQFLIHLPEDVVEGDG
jgi:effector-binding domain-containing protein